MTAADPASSHLVLASRSAARSMLLRNAGLQFTTDAAPIDEAAIAEAVRAAGGDAAQAATALAEAKAVAVSKTTGGALVIGADQILDCKGVWFDKPPHMARARNDLLALRGTDHRQFSAAAVARNGAVLWRHVDSARLTMRPFTDRFLDDHLALVGEAVLACAGAYQLEGPGVQLFSAIEGDYFTILGLPLLPLLSFLREQGVAAT